MPTLAWIGALLVGVTLGLLGSGGSILTIPVLVYLVGQEEKVAIAGSLAIVGSVSLAGSVPHALKRNIQWPSVWLFGLPGMAGTYLGAFLSGHVTGGTQLAVFAVVMLGAAFLMVRPVKLTDAPHRRRAAWKIVIDGLCVGTLTGFVGVGGGFMIVPALVLLGGMGMHHAVGTSLFIIAMNSASGFYKHTHVLADAGLQLDWTVIATFASLGIVGSFVGSALSTRIPQAHLRRGFGVLLFVMAGYILWRELG
ncbi:MAG: sulfite exporter TauE/SafE family protein [Planctomycetes bacterium]|nr:sulfite exporter TauE/SafE family protein [Planctomycetota bacterium]